METLTTTFQEEVDTFDASNDSDEMPAKGVLFTPEQVEMGKQRRLVKIAGWEKLDTRQTFADARYMRGILRAAGARSPLRVEPASAQGLKLHLRRAGLQRADIIETVGCTVEVFLEKNPKLPLWAALALVLEATGKYDEKAIEFAKEEELLENP